MGLGEVCKGELGLGRYVRGELGGRYVRDGAGWEVCKGGSWVGGM